MTPPLIFLDFDGVINSHDWWNRRVNEPEPPEIFGTYEIDPLACKRLQTVCDATGAQLVVSSTWRASCTIAELQELLSRRGLTAPVIGRTPDLNRHVGLIEDRWQDVGRGLEIQWWLQTYVKDLNDCRFVILDDDSDMGDLLGKLVQTRCAYGIIDRDLDYVYRHLDQTLLESRAAGGQGTVEFKYNVLKNMTPWWNRQKGPFGPA